MPPCSEIEKLRRLFSVLRLGVLVFGFTIGVSAQPVHLEPRSAWPAHSLNVQANNDLKIHGDWAYIAAGYGGLHILNISNPSNPGSISGGYHNGSSITAVAVDGSYAFITDERHGLQVVNVTDPTNLRILGTNNIVGACYGLIVRSNFVYCANRSGFLVVDVSNPAFPRIRGEIPLGFSTDVQLIGHYAYVVENQSLHVVDIREPDAPRIVYTHYTGDLFYKVTIKGNLAMLTRSSHAGVDILNIDDPALPVPAGDFNSSDFPGNVALSGDFAYFASTWGGLQVLDIRDVNDPMLVTTLTFKGMPFHCVVVGTNLYVSETDGRGSGKGLGLRVFDISAPEIPVKIGDYDNAGYLSDIAVSGRAGYAACGYAGIQVLDFTTLERPARISYFDTGGYAERVKLSWNYLFAADAETGLHVIDVEGGAHPKGLGIHSTNGLFAFDVEKDLVCTLSADGFTAFRMEGSNLVEIAKIPTSDKSITIHNSQAYLADKQLTVYDVSDTNVAITGRCDLSRSVSELVSSADYAFGLAVWPPGIEVIDIRNPSAPVVIASPEYSALRYAARMELSRNWLFVASQYNGIHLFDVRDPKNLRDCGLLAPLYSEGITISGDFAYVARGMMGLNILQLLEMKLTVGNEGNVLKLKWPRFDSGFLLESTDNLSFPSWTRLSDVPLIEQEYYSLGVIKGTNSKFFRLVKPKD